MTSDLRRAAVQGSWIAYWRLWARYHRYECQGFEHLEGGRPCLVAGYHGRPVSFDLCMLSVLIQERLGYLPHGIFHRTLFGIPVLRDLLDDLGAIPGDGPGLRRAVDRGEHLLVTPGGTREAHRGSRCRYVVDWGDRTGYIRLAARYRLPIVPVASSGVDDCWVALADGQALGRRLHLPGEVPAWIALGPLGPWPVSPPFPVRFRQRIGPAIEDTAMTGFDAGDRDAVAGVHRKVTTAVQDLLDRART